MHILCALGKVNGDLLSLQVNIKVLFQYVDLFEVGVDSIILYMFVSTGKQR